MGKLMANTKWRMELKMGAIRPIVLDDQVPDEHLVAHAREVALCAVDGRTIYKLGQHLHAQFGNLPHDGSVLDRGDIHLVAPRSVDKIEASADISGGCHRLDADRLSECSFLGKLQSSNCMVLGMAVQCVLAARKEIDLAWTFHDSEPDRASAPICPWTVVDHGRLHRLTSLLVYHS